MKTFTSQAKLAIFPSTKMIVARYNQKHIPMWVAEII